MSNTNPNYRATLVILNDIEKKGLYHFNPEYHDEQFFLNFIDFQKRFSNSLSEIIRRLDESEMNSEDVIFFTIYSMTSFINSHFKIFEKFLKIVINPQKLKGGFDENTTLNQMLKKICNKMQYNLKLKNAIHGMFLSDFSDAVSQNYYSISKDGYLTIFSKDNPEKKKIGLDELYDYSLQVRTIFNAMLNWADNSEVLEKNKFETIDGIVKNLINQVDSLDEKLTRISS